jgi:hypothetical protein
LVITFFYKVIFKGDETKSHKPSTNLERKKGHKSRRQRARKELLGELLEKIYNFILSNKETSHESKALLDYFRYKTIGYNSNRILQRAFSV